jgi:hypothetical protein
MKPKINLISVLAVLGVVVLGFFREFLFIHINEQLFALWYDEPSQATNSIPWLKELDYFTLYYGKWVLTIFFAAAFYFAALLVLRYLFDQSYWRELGWIYLGLITLSGLALGIGKLASQLDDAYLIARFLMGIAQSPLLLMIMVPGVMLRQRSA